MTDKEFAAAVQKQNYRLCEENKTLRRELEALRKTAALLQQNAEGCAANHYGHDLELHGLPGWLTDTKTSIDKAAAVLAAQ